MAPYEGKSILGEDIDTEPRDREISLSPGIILVVFFALALVCAVFFGFGYSVGRRSDASAPVAALPAVPTLSGSKPSPGSFVASGRQEKVPAPEREESSPEIPQPTSPHAESSASHRSGSPSASVQAPTKSGTVAVAKTSTNFRAPSVVSMASTAQTSTPLPAGMAMVQVAAFSHQQDADLVAGALRKRGYDVNIRQQAQDSLLHVQLGPFASKKEAEAMRQRLQADGYNAILK